MPPPHVKAKTNRPSPSLPFGRDSQVQGRTRQVPLKPALIVATCQLPRNVVESGQYLVRPVHGKKGHGSFKGLSEFKNPTRLECLAEERRACRFDLVRAEWCR